MNCCGVQMRKIFGAIFGSPKNTETIVSGAAAGLDKIFFTKEEKSEANQKLADWYLKYLAATQPQNLARRLLAIIVALLWAFLILFGIGVRWFSYEMSDFVFKTMDELVHQPFMLIMGFYFLAHVVRTYQNGSAKK